MGCTAHCVPSTWVHRPLRASLPAQPFCYVKSQRNPSAFYITKWVPRGNRTLDVGTTTRSFTTKLWAPCVGTAPL